VVTEPFGTLSDGQEVRLFTLTNPSGAKVCLSDYGARVVSIFVPGKDGKPDDVVPGPGDVETFEKGDRFMGCTIGRYGNRINHASFEIDGVRYNLVANEEFGGERCNAMAAPRGSTVSCGIPSPFSKAVSPESASIV
jgi:aldose 1-epimerase